MNYTNASTFNPALAGVLAVNQVAANISYNSITSNTAGNNDGTIIGIYVVDNGTLAYPASAHTANINNNTLALATNAFSSAAALPLVFGIRNTIGNANTTLNINSNNFTKIEHVVSAHAGADTLISNKAAALVQNITYNKFTNLTIGNTGVVVLIGNAMNTPAAGVQNCSYNSIEGTLVRTAAGALSTNCIVTSTAATTTASDATINWTYNNLSNVTAASGGFTGFINFDGPTSGNGVNKNISFNTVSNISAPSGATGISINQRGSNGDVGHLIKGNILTNFTAGATGNVFGIITSSSSTTLTVTIDSNLIDNYKGQQMTGINCTAGKLATVSNNTITRLSGSAASSSFYGIQLSNTIAGEVSNVFNNKISNIENSGVVTSLVAVYGIYKACNTNANTATLNAYNNRISDLRAPNATSLSTVCGISIGQNGTSAGGVTANIFYNTVFLNATTTAATSGSSSLMFPGGTSSVTLNLRNNILVNLSTPGTNASNSNANGVSACLRRITGSGVVPTNYAATSNNNLFWANPTAGTNNHLTYVEGYSAATTTVSQNTLANWTTFLASASKTMDNLSVTENPAFQSVIATDANLLKINPGYIQLVNNAGAAITTPISVTTDFEGDARSGSTPDIGADEYTQADNAVVPVSLAMLNGRKSGIDNLLTWSTYTETNNSGFDVQRSSNGTSFVTIGSVASKSVNGFSASKLDYNFTDRNVAAGKFYYRLLQKDIDGNSKLSNVIAISDKATGAGIAGLHPNPATSFVSVNINATVSDKMQLLITDMNGKQVKVQTAQVLPGTNSVGIDVSKLPNGIYSVTIQMNELGKSVTERFIKQ